MLWIEFSFFNSELTHEGSLKSKKRKVNNKVQFSYEKKVRLSSITVLDAFLVEVLALENEERV